MRKTNDRAQYRWAALRLIPPLLAAGTLVACGGADEEQVIATLIENGQPAITWEEFKSSVYREPWPGGAYIVDGDIPLHGEEALLDYYLSYAEQDQALTVNQIFGTDDIWSYPERFHLTYCVSNNFGTRKNQVVNTMAAAAASWHDLVGVHFTYLASQDTNCTASNNNVTFDVRLVSASYFARSFFPSDSRADSNLLITNSAFTTTAGGRDFNGILRHELGHTMGFRHEHIHLTPACTSESDTDNRQLTAYDVNSVMHYPQCRPSGTGGYRQTELDYRGARSLYGTAPQLIDAANCAML